VTSSWFLIPQLVAIFVPNESPARHAAHALSCLICTQANVMCRNRKSPYLCCGSYHISCQSTTIYSPRQTR